MKTVQMFLNIALQKKLFVQQLNVKNAFLHSEMNKEIYVAQSPGFENGSKGCKLCKVVYGLKISPKIQNKYIIDEIKFKRLEYDSCIYKRMLGKIETFLLVYVNNILIMSNQVTELEILKYKLQEKFEITDVGDLKTCLEIEVLQQRKRRDESWIDCVY